MQATLSRTAKKRQLWAMALYFILPITVSRMIYPSRDAALMWSIFMLAYGAALVVWAEKFPILRDQPSVIGWKIWGGAVVFLHAVLVSFLFTAPSPPSGPWQQFATWSDGSGLEAQWFLDTNTIETIENGRRAAWLKLEYNLPCRSPDGSMLRSTVLRVLVDCQQQRMGTLYEDDFTNNGLAGAMTSGVRTTPEEVQMRPISNENFYLWNQNVCQRT